MQNDILKHNLEFQNYLSNEEAVVNQNLLKKVVPTTKYEDYNFLKVVGRGNSGQVVYAHHIVSDKIVAIKIIKKETLKNSTRLTQLQREIRILNSINFEFLISLDCYFTNTCYVFLVMPFISGGKFFELLRHSVKFDEMTARFFVGQVVLAIDYLHHMGIIYRDIKPENIVIDEYGYLKLVDFGFAKKIGKNLTYTFCGTPEYLAPEILKHKGYNRSPDWWTLGVLLFEMCSGSSPFFADNEYLLYEKIINGYIIWPSYFSSNLKSLLRGLLQVDKTKRLGCMKNGSDDVKNHKWFDSFNWNALWHKTIVPPPKVTSGLVGSHHLFRATFHKLKFAMDCPDLESHENQNIDFEV